MDAVFGQQVVGGGGSHPARYNMDSVKDIKILDTDIPADQPDDYTVAADRWHTIEATIAPPQ